MSDSPEVPIDTCPNCHQPIERLASDLGGFPVSFHENGSFLCPDLKVDLSPATEE